jgi:hypothetical protein
LSNEVYPYEKKGAHQGINMNAVEGQSVTSVARYGRQRMVSARKSEIRVRPIRARCMTGEGSMPFARDSGRVGLCTGMRDGTILSKSEVLGL